MNRIMKGVAGVAAGALALSGLALVTAESASAATSNNVNRYQCTTVTDVAGTFVSSTQPNYDITLNANGVTPGNNITVTGSFAPVAAETGPPAINAHSGLPNNGPVALTGYVQQSRIQVAYQVNGGAVQTAMGAYGANSTAASVASNGQTQNVAPGTITIPGAGLVNGDVVTILPNQFSVSLSATNLGGLTGVTTCDASVAPTPSNALTVNVLNAATASITAVSGQTNPAYGRSGATATVTGSSWGPSAGNTFTKQNCDSAGANCGTSAAAAGLSVTGSTLSGTVAVGGNNLGTGARTFKITASPSGQSVTIPINILGTRSQTISPSQGGSGVLVTVTVSNFDTGSNIIAFGANAVALIAAGAPGCAPGCNITIPVSNNANSSTVPQQGTASATGTGSAGVNITDPATIAVGAVQGASIPATPWGASTPVSVLAFGASSAAGNFTYGVNSCSISAAGLPAPQCSNIEFLQMQVNAGDLTLSQDPANATVTLSTITLNGSNQVSTGSVNGPSSLSIVDARGTDTGWSITGGLTNFSNQTVLTGPNRTIPATNMSWTPTCAPVAPTTGTAVPAATQNFATGTLADPSAAAAVATAPLCSVAAGQGGGSFTADAALNLTVPPTVKTGLYTATLYLQIA